MTTSPPLPFVESPPPEAGKGLRARAGAGAGAGAAAGAAAGLRRAAAGDGGTVLVTGGCGFIGSHVVELLLGLGYSVRVLDNLSTGHRAHLPASHPLLHVVEGDIRDLEACRAAMEGVTGILHLGAQSKVLPSMLDPNPSMARFCLDNNVVGTQNVLQAAWEAGGVRKVVYSGSSTYYGMQPPPHHEGLLPDLTTPYAASKYQGEVLMGMYSKVYGIPTAVLRLFMVYGPRQPSEGPYAIVTGIFMRQAAMGEALTIEGDGSQTRDFVHVRDVARAFVGALQGGPGGGEVVNVGSGTETSIKDVADLVSPVQVHRTGRPYDLKRTRADTSRAKKLLGWEASISFQEGMGELGKPESNLCRALSPST